MTSRRLTTLVSAALLTTWLVSAAVTQRDDAPAPIPAQATPPAITAVDELEIQTARLRARLDAAPAPHRSARNPFRFGHRIDTADRPAAPARPAAIGEPASTAAAPPDAAARAPAPTLRLIGIAIADDAEGGERTAAISVSGELMLVRVGGSVAGRYLVSAITPDVVELADRLGGAPLRLALR